jgi:hypothetical protein
MLKPNDQISVIISLSRTVNVTDDAAAIATLAGLSLEDLSGVVEDGNDWEPEESVIERMAGSGSADIEAEEWDVEEINEV